MELYFPHPRRRHLTEWVTVMNVGPDRVESQEPGLCSYKRTHTNYNNRTLIQSGNRLYSTRAYYTRKHTGEDDCGENHEFIR